MGLHITKEQAQIQLNAWLDANLAVSTGQSYKIGSRTLTRADASHILTQIKYWQGVLDEIVASETNKSRNRAYRIVPRD